jgi:hypothetical protein
VDLARRGRGDARAARSFVDVRLKRALTLTRQNAPMIDEQIQALGQELAAFAKTGPTSPTHAADITHRIDALIAANCISVEDAIAGYREHCEAFLVRVIEAKGMPVVSVMSPGPDGVREPPKSVDKGVTARFDELLPGLRALLDEHVTSYAEQAEMFFAKQKLGFDQELTAFLAGIPAGGTKTALVRSHVNPLKRTLNDLVQWDADMHRLQSMSVVSEVDDFLRPSGGDALAMSWHYAPSSCLVPSHKALDGRVYVVRDTWAIKKGLVHAGPNGFTDETRKFRREIGCMCSSTWLFYALSLPEEVLTPEGIEMKANAPAKRAAFEARMGQALSPEAAPSPPPQPVPTAAPDRVAPAAPTGFFAKLFGRKAS